MLHVEGDPGYMEPKTFEERLLFDLEQGWMTAEEVQGILRQRDIFNQRRKTLEKKYRGKVVGMAGGRVFVGDTVQEVLTAAQAALPDQPVYFEPIGVDLFQ